MSTSDRRRAVREFLSTFYLDPWQTYTIQFANVTVRHCVVHAVEIVAKGCGNQRFRIPHSFGTHPAASFTGRGLFGMLGNCVSFSSRPVTLSLFTKAKDVALRLLSQKYDGIVDIRGSTRRFTFVSGALSTLGRAGYFPLHASMFHCLAQYGRRFSFVFTSPPCTLGKLSALPRLIFRGSLLGGSKLFILRRKGRRSFSGRPYFGRHHVCNDMGFSFFGGTRAPSR